MDTNKLEQSCATFSEIVNKQTYPGQEEAFPWSRLLIFHLPEEILVLNLTREIEQTNVIP